MMLDDNIDCLIVMTELEPDDVLAIILLLRNLRRKLPILIVVGEGRVNKVDMARCIVRDYEFKFQIEIVQGFYSDKDYPLEALEIYETKINLSEPTAVETIITYLNIYKNPFILGIKPPRELLVIDRNLLSHVTLAQYGSFNLRCLFKTYKDINISNWLNTSFKEVFLYESFFATGLENSVSDKQLFEIISFKYEELYKLIKVWNDHISTDCLDSIVDNCTKLKTSEWDEKKILLNKIDRSLKIVKNIVDANNKQMVLADFALVVLLLNDSSKYDLRVGEIAFDEFGYTTINDKPDGKVTIPCNVNVKYIVDYIVGTIMF